MRAAYIQSRVKKRAYIQRSIYSEQGLKKEHIFRAAYIQSRVKKKEHIFRAGLKKEHIFRAGFTKLLRHCDIDYICSGKNKASERKKFKVFFF